jgi:endonuclease/exonuclease/phosphatase family metal-dependent hydrolase
MDASEPALPGVRSWNATTLAVALSTAVGVASIRVLVPEIYRLREDAGLIAAATVALLVFASPAVGGGVRRVLGPRGAIGGVLIAQAITWVALQRIHPIPWPVAAVPTVLALIGWTMLLHTVRSTSSADGAAFTVAFVLGLTLDTSIHAAFRTWDIAWREAVVATVTYGVLAGALMVSALLASRRPAAAVENGFPRSLPLAGLGVYLVLNLLFLQNVAFVDSATGFDVVGGTIVVLIGDLAAIAGLIRRRAGARRLRVGAAIALVVSGWLLTSGTSSIVVLSVVVGSVTAAQLLSASLSRGEGTVHTSAWRTSLAIAIGGVVFVGCALLYQIHVTNPLPFSNRWIPVAAAALLGLTGSSRRVSDARIPRTAIFAPAVLLVATPVLIVLTAPRPMAHAAEGVTRVMDWNVHSAIDANGMLDPRAIAQEILTQHASIVVLEEVPRGWLIAGTIDLADWLADELHMSMAWAPAADGQFGNVILSEATITSSEVIALPYGAGPQHRSALRIETTTFDGKPLAVVGTHLESKEGTSTGADQIRAIVDDLGSTSPVIIAGDMNMQPDDPEVLLFTGAGFMSAQDATGHTSESTSRDPNVPGDRVDWIFGRDVTFGSFQIAPSVASDHLPLVVTVSV